MLTDLGELSEVGEPVDVGPDGVEDGHVVGLRQELLLQALEDRQRVPEQHLQQHCKRTFNRREINAGGCARKRELLYSDRDPIWTLRYYAIIQLMK